MHKTKLLVGLVFGTSVLFAGCTKQPTSEQLQVPATQTEGQAMKEYEKIAAAMKDGKSVRCVMSNTETQETMTYAVKGKKVSVKGIAGYEGAGGETGSMLMDEKYMYTWSDAKKEGVKFAIPAEVTGQPTPAQRQDIPSLETEEDQQRYEDMGYSVVCDQTEVADSEFVPPSDIVFTDASAMMQQAEEMQKNLEAQNGSAQDMDAMMEQYKNMVPEDN